MTGAAHVTAVARDVDEAKSIARTYSFKLVRGHSPLALFDWPRPKWAPDPLNMIELRPSTPMAFEALAMTVLASWARAVTGSSATSAVAAIQTLFMTSSG